MEKKRKFMVCALLLVLLAMPLALSMMRYQPTILEDLSVRPVRDFGLSANCAVSTTDTGVTNPDDTDNLYGGGYKTYIAVVNTSYATGAAITNITTTFYKGATDYASVLFVQSTGLFSESAGSTKIRLDTSTNVTSGAYCNLTLNFKLEWAMDDVDDVDMNITVWNVDNSTSSQKDANYDFDTDLVITPTDFISQTGIGAGGLINVVSTTFSYEDSGGDNYPLDAETDFYLTRTPSTGLTDQWNPSSYSDVTGIAAWASMSAGHIAQTESFAITAYIEGGTTTDLMGATYSDSVGVANVGGGDDDDGIGFIIDWNLVGMIAIVAIGGYMLMTSGVLDRGKTTRRKRPKAKPTRKKSKRRK